MVTVGHDQTILHILRNGNILLLLLVTLLHLFPQGIFLFRNASHKRNQFFILHLIERVIEIDGFQRFHHALCRPVYNKETDGQKENHRDQQHTYTGKKRTIDTVNGVAHAQNLSIIQTYCSIVCTLCICSRVTTGMTVSFCHRLSDLRTRCMIFHFCGIFIRVIQDISSCIHKCKPTFHVLCQAGLQRLCSQFIDSL